jgi:twitching motility protein PilT
VDNVTFLDSLLDAIIRLDGDALVMHVGEKPYVVTTSSAMNSLRGPLSWGQVELSSRPLTCDAVVGMLAQILPDEQRRLLDDIGAIEHELPGPGAGAQPFILTAARGGDDVWVEVRRKKEPIEPPVVVEEPEPVEILQPAIAESVPAVAEVVEEALPAPESEPLPEPMAAAGDEPSIELVPETPEEVAPVYAAEAIEEPEIELVAEATEAPEEPVAEPETVEEPAVVLVAAEEPEPEPEAVPGWTHGISLEANETFEIVSEDAAVEYAEALEDAAEPTIVLTDAEPTIELLETEPAAELTVGEPAIHLLAEDTPIEIVQQPAAWDEIPMRAAVEAPEAIPAPTVVSISKPALKLQPPPPAAEAPAASTEASLVALLKAAAARGASTLYAVADSRPMIRVDGEIALLGTEAAVTGAEVDRFTFEFAPRDQIADAAPEWTCAVKGVGRVRAVTFHDDSGTGLIFHLPSPNVSTADEIGLSARVQALCGEADGLVVIAAPRGNGKSTLLDAFVDLINRTRYDHVITIESHIRTAHEKRHSFISQRKAEPDGEAIAAAARAALREGPDVLVIEDLRAPEALSVALDAARAGRLVFGGIAAPTAPAAVERLIGAFPADRRAQVRALLSTSLRAVVAQLLVRKPNGGRVGARELLLHSPAVEKLILDGALGQLPLAIEGGRRLGMVTMNDALGALVRDGGVDVAEACRCAPDRETLIAALERDGIDVSSVERRA